MKGNIFIKRPVMAFSISILILIVGFISLGTLPIEQYPDIAPPTVRVSATYTGASADAVMKSVIQPLEEAINGVENMTYMQSTATKMGTRNTATTITMPLSSMSSTRTAHRSQTHWLSPFTMTGTRTFFC